MVRVVTLSEAHEHLHYSSRRFRDCLLAEILATSNRNAKLSCNNNTWQNNATTEDLIDAINGNSNPKNSQIKEEANYLQYPLPK
ncbi:hypothetical protein PGB90_001862 [Kerria lacca]